MRQTGPVPGQPGYGQAPDAVQAPQEWGRPAPRRRGVLSALLDSDFNALVTPSLVKTIYVLALIVVSLECLGILTFGVWVLVGTEYWVSGAVVILATPFVWLLQMLVTRTLMEAVVIRFKQAEYLRIIKDKL